MRDVEAKRAGHDALNFHPPFGADGGVAGCHDCATTIMNWLDSKLYCCVIFNNDG
jgi:hypothetical protein